MVINGRESEAISFDEFDLDTAHRRLLRNGEALAINAKTFDLLTFLIENNGRLISKDEILEAVWPDQFVEEANLSVQISALRKALGEKKGEPRFLVTIPGKGYKFVADIGAADDRFVLEKHRFERVVIDEIIEETENLAVGPIKRGTSRTSKLVLVIAGFALVAVVGLFAYRYFSPPPVSQIESLAVLPFTNQNEAAETEYLSDGLAESVIHSLSRMRELRVMSRNSAFRFRGNEIDARQIGQEL